MRHRGEILEKAVRNTGISIYKVAEKFDVSQRTMYTLFQREHIPDMDMVRYGRAIGIDFSRDIPELIDFMIVNDPQEVYEANINYRQKYLELLEKHVEQAEELKKLLDEFEKIAAPSEPTAPKVRQKKKSK